MRRMTEKQIILLGIVENYGPIDADEVSRHTLLPTENARSTLRSLERRGYIDAYYTGRHRGRAYTISSAGQDALEAEAPKEDE